MPVRDSREYRNMPLLVPATNKRLDSEYYVEGHATTFEQPYLLFESNGWKYYEVIDRNAFIGCDISDVLFQYNHSGKVFARSRMGKGHATTMILETDEIGLFIAADLSKTSESRAMYEDIDSGLIYQMSLGFTVATDEITRDESTKICTRRITKFKKLYDVSAVDVPANAATDISARSWLDGVIEAMTREESAKREQKRKKIQLLIDMEVNNHDS